MRVDQTILQRTIETRRSPLFLLFSNSTCFCFLTKSFQLLTVSTDRWHGKVNIELWLFYGNVMYACVLCVMRYQWKQMNMLVFAFVAFLFCLSVRWIGFWLYYSLLWHYCCTFRGYLMAKWIRILFLNKLKIVYFPLRVPLQNCCCSFNKKNIYVGLVN